MMIFALHMYDGAQNYGLISPHNVLLVAFRQIYGQGGVSKTLMSS